MDHTFTKPKGKFFMEFTLSSIYLRKCNRYSIMIVNKLHDWWQMGTDRCEQKWWTKLDKLFVLIYVYMCCKKFVVVQLSCCANYLIWKQKVPCIPVMYILILEAKFVRKKCTLYTGKYQTNWICTVMMCCLLSLLESNLLSPPPSFCNGSIFWPSLCPSVKMNNNLDNF